MNFKNDLIKRIAILVGIVEFITFSVFGFLYSEKYASQLEKDLQNRLIEINKMISNEELSVSSLSRKNFISSMIGTEYISGFAVGNNGYVLVSSEPKYLGTNIKDLPNFDINWNTTQVGVKFYTVKTKLTSIGFLSNDNLTTPLYKIIITLDTKKFDSMKSNLLIMSILGSILFVILSSTAIIMLAKRFLTKRIDNTLEVLAKAENGNLNTQIIIDEFDEIGKVQHGINALIKKVERLVNQYENSIHEIESSKIFIKKIIDTVPVSIFWKDTQGKYLGVNKLFLGFANLNHEEEIIGKTDFDLVWKDNAQAFINDDNLVMKSRTAKSLFEEKLPLGENKFRYLLTSKTPLIDERGKVYGILGVFNDITEVKIAEKQLEEKNLILIEQSKLASMGEMIGNIAHQWRQPLSIISTSASGLQLKSEMNMLTENDIGDSVSVIIKQANYLSNTIDSFRNFIKGDKVFKKISLKEIINNTFSLVEASLHNNFIIPIIDIEENLVVEGNQNELTEAIINIINNSKDSLKINVSNEKDRFIFVDASKNSDETIQINIKDSAGGISTEIINRIFEPYFTTKHQSIGTGLGLFISDQIIRERHNGIIKVYNETFTYNGKIYTGACFTIILKSA